jgi:hypothetical protein
MDGFMTVEPKEMQQQDIQPGNGFVGHAKLNLL